MKDGAVLIEKPKQFVPNLVCVVDNGWMAAAAYIYSENEFMCFADISDPRPKRWFIWNKVKEYAQ
jgi:hypothetical protein